MCYKRSGLRLTEGMPLRGEERNTKKGRIDRKRKALPLCSRQTPECSRPRGSTFRAQPSPCASLLAKLHTPSPTLIRLYSLVTLCSLHIRDFFLIFLFSRCLCVPATTRVPFLSLSFAILKCSLVVPRPMRPLDSFLFTSVIPWFKTLVVLPDFYASTRNISISLVNPT